MMVGYGMTYNLKKKIISWKGVITSFDLKISGLETATSTFSAPSFTGSTDDLFLFIQVEGFGYITVDGRIKMADSEKHNKAISGPAFYYGVVTSYENNEIQCAFMDKFLDQDYVPEPIPDEKDIPSLGEYRSALDSLPDAKKKVDECQTSVDYWKSRLANVNSATWDGVRSSLNNAYSTWLENLGELGHAGENGETRSYGYAVNTMQKSFENSDGSNVLVIFPMYPLHQYENTYVNARVPDSSGNFNRVDLKGHYSYYYYRGAETRGVAECWSPYTFDVNFDMSDKGGIYSTWTGPMNTILSSFDSERTAARTNCQNNLNDAESKLNSATTVYNEKLNTIHEFKVFAAKHGITINGDTAYINIPGISGDKNPLHFLAELYDKWIERYDSPLIVDWLGNDRTPYRSVESAGDMGIQEFSYPVPTSASTTKLIDYYHTLFKYYQVTFVPYADSFNASEGKGTGKVYGAFISGKEVGSVIVDKSKWIINPSLYVRPVLDGNSNAITVVQPYMEKSTSTEKTTVDGNTGETVTETTDSSDILAGIQGNKTVYMRNGAFSKDNPKYVFDQSNPDIIKPIKRQVYIYSGDEAEDADGIQVALTDAQLTKIAAEQLSAPSYSHQITFDVHKNYPRANDLAHIGNLVTLYYRGQPYKSVVSAVEIKSSDDYFTVTCGNLLLSLRTLLTYEEIVKQSGGSVATSYSDHYVAMSKEDADEILKGTSGL